MGNISILKIVVIGLVVALLILICGVIYLIGQDKSIPGNMETMIGMIITGLLGLLAPSRTAAKGE